MKKRRRRIASRRKRRTVGEFTLSPRRRPRRQSALRLNASRAVMLALIAVIVFCLVMIGSILLRTARTKKLNAELAAMRAAQIAAETPVPTMPEATPAPTATPEPAASPSPSPTAGPVVTTTEYHRASGTPLAHMEALYEQNRDLIGWVEIPGIIDLPVMYKDNSYYLTHDFNKSKSAAGTIFLDKNHRFTERTQNLLLHGHNMKDGTMFGRLVHYLQEIDYYRAHPFVNFDTLWEEEEYVIFSVLRVPLDVSDEGFINYFSHPTFTSDEAFDAYVRQLQLSSVYAIPINVKPSDALLTLSTCIDEDRLVIVCRRVREGESHSRLRELARAAIHQ